MTAVLNTSTTTSSHDLRRADRRTIDSPRPLTRQLWTWAGLVAGISGVAATLILNLKTPSEAQADAGVDGVFQVLDNQRAVQIGACLGFVAAYALAVFAAGYARHVARRAPEGSLLPQVVRLAMTAGVGTLIIGFGLKAAAAGGMPGGIDEAFYTKTDSTVTALIAGQMQWVGWQGVAIAMAATAIGVFRYRIVQRWIGAVAILFSLMVAVFTLVLCLPYSAGIVAPPFLVLLSVALLTTRKHRS